MNSQFTRYAFLAGAAYFMFMAIAHFFGIKVPVLFVYWDTPFYAYQDKIISFAVCAYVALFCLRTRRIVAMPERTPKNRDSPRENERPAAVKACCCPLPSLRYLRST